MDKIKLYFVEAYDELINKVTWPTWPELQSSTVVVLVAALLISVAVVAMDVVFRMGTVKFYELIIR